MFATEHADRFTIALPNGQTMDVSKDGLKPETEAQLRSMAIPGMQEGGGKKDADIAQLESEVESLSAPAPASAPAPQMSVLAQLAQDAVAAQQSAAPVVDPVVPVAPVAAVPEPVTPPRPASMLNWSNSLPDSLPGIGLPVAPEMVNMTSELREQPDAMFLTPQQAKTAGERVANVAVDVPPPERGVSAPQTAPIAPQPDPDTELRSAFSRFMQQGATRAPQIGGGGIGRQVIEPFTMPESYDKAIKTVQDIEKQKADLDALDAQQKFAAAEKGALEKQRIADEMAMKSAAEQRRLDQMRDDAFNGKIDMNRAFDRMDNGQRAMTWIGLALGAIGAGNNGVNAAAALLDKMVERDIDAQAKDLGRKQTAYSNAIQQGYHAEQARQVAKAEAFSLIDGAIARAAMKNGSERALLNGQAVSAELGLQREKLFADMSAKDFDRKMQYAQMEQARQAHNQSMAMQAAKMNLDRQTAALSTMTKLREAEGKLAHTLPDKSVVIASNPTSKAKLEEVQGAHEEMMRKIEEARALREKYGGGTIVPNSKALRALGVDAAVYADEAASLAGQMELAWLRGEGAGAYDKGSGEKAKEIMPSAADLGEEAFKNKMDRLERLANEQFRSRIIALTRPESAKRF